MEGGRERERERGRGGEKETKGECRSGCETEKRGVHTCGLNGTHRVDTERTAHYAVPTICRLLQNICGANDLSVSGTKPSGVLSLFY